MMLAAGLPPDPWQGEFLRSKALRTLMLCSRQSGKSTTVATKALAKARTINDVISALIASGSSSAQLSVSQMSCLTR